MQTIVTVVGFCTSTGVCTSYNYHTTRIRLPSNWNHLHTQQDHYLCSILCATCRGRANAEHSSAIGEENDADPVDRCRIKVEKSLKVEYTPGPLESLFFCARQY